MLIPSDLINLAVGEFEAAAGSVVERVSVQDQTLLGLALELQQELESGLTSGALYWSELSDRIAMQIV